MITVQESHRVSWSHLIFLCGLWHWKPCGTTCCCSLDISSPFKIYLLIMKLGMAYLMLLFLKPREMKTNFILITEKALKIRTDSKNKKQWRCANHSSGMIQAGVSYHNVQLVSSELNVLHPERRFYTLSWKHAHSFYPSAYCVLLCACLFRCRGYEPERILTSAKGRNNKHYISEFLAESLLLLSCLCFYVDALSTN